MTHSIALPRKAMTALAAVLAFSSTPLVAQETTPPPDIDTSVEPPAATDPLAPEPATEAAPPPAPRPKVETARGERATRSSSPAPNRAPIKRASAAAPAAAAAAPAAPAALPAEAPPPVAAEPAAPLPAAETAPASAVPDAQPADLLTGDALPVAGAAALGLLGLAGAGLVARRRKRRREDAEFEARQQALATIEEEPPLELGPADEVQPAPVFARRSSPMHDPVPQSRTPVAGSSDGLDASRFGRHVQAAYRGPTDDNPSVSLEYRLRRASMLDEQEREALEQAGTAGGNQWESRPAPDFMFRRAGKKAEHPADQD
jgi:LPXTG-motif cell wall-anchored protein